MQGDVRDAILGLGQQCFRFVDADVVEVVGEAGLGDVVEHAAEVRWCDIDPIAEILQCDLLGVMLLDVVERIQEPCLISRGGVLQDVIALQEREQVGDLRADDVLIAVELFFVLLDQDMHHATERTVDFPSRA